MKVHTSPAKQRVGLKSLEKCTPACDPEDRHGSQDNEHRPCQAEGKLGEPNECTKCTCVTQRVSSGA